MVAKRDPFALYCDEPSLTQQHFSEECDINEILRRSAISGQLPVNDKVPMYGDFTVVPKSLLESFALIKQANDLFMSMSWQVRERFANDPQRMIEFLNDPKNRDEAVKLGLVKPLPKADVVAEAPASDAAPASPPAGGPVGGAAQ